ncbi:DUF3626 domain-containing protein [Paractinoplanes atraurantiacus]|uniref:DUF3626 domain-containing protein n=1 Tax=Paractinoplanes atraurantiacus TaxID=1036182 RepID=A0A285IAP4_9ACTN|nr:DUF3626 domain-containing protein [Actinoplanes atraurantiacus]SNY44857.1 Protein of unknown function [Actinoplanes atraurantiacus]
MISPSQRALEHVRGLFPEASPVPAAPITVNFHPDRLLAGGATVAERLAGEGVYRSQFETGISNGGLTAYPGGDRDRWEQRMFGGAYTGAAGRPLYGGLNLACYPDGASPRFGSCHLVLAEAVSLRATFSHGDSFTEPAVVGTATTFRGVWESLLSEVARTGRALNLPAPGPAEWVRALGVPRTAAGRAMDDYVEAQIHGGLTLAADVTAVVADPSFRGTPVEAHLRALGSPLRWAPGFRLAAAEFPAELRGPEVPALAAAVGERFGRETLDAELVGRAAREPSTWAGFGGRAEVLQLLKYVWHILVLRGEPAG